MGKDKKEKKHNEASSDKQKEHKSKKEKKIKKSKDREEEISKKPAPMSGLDQTNTKKFKTEAQPAQEYASAKSGATDKKNNQNKNDQKKNSNNNKNNNKNNDKRIYEQNSVAKVRFTKNFSDQLPALSTVDQDQVKKFWSEKQVMISELDAQGKDTSAPRYTPLLTKFSDLSFESDTGLLNFLKLPQNAAIKEPSPIQATSWPILFAGQDLIGVAKTGSGKTLAFGLPLIYHVQQNLANFLASHPLALVIAPTRELAIQSSEVLQEIAQSLPKSKSSPPIAVTCLYGGIEKTKQKPTIPGAQVVVATPGRLQDFMGEESVFLDRVTYVVLDEADRMLDMGFEPEIRRIMAEICTARQTLMFSATFPPVVQTLARRYFLFRTSKDQVSNAALNPKTNPFKIVVGNRDVETASANANIQQIVEVIEDTPKVKERRLLELLKKYYDKTKKNRILIFVLYKKEVPQVERLLRANKYAFNALHGNATQPQREAALQAFRTNTPILIATDVAARGLDIPDITHVINFTFPLTIEDYVHRIGRTARGYDTNEESSNKIKGIAHTFFVCGEPGVLKRNAALLVGVLEKSGQPVPKDLLKFGVHVKKEKHDMYGDFFKEPAGSVDDVQHITFDSDSD